MFTEFVNRIKANSLAEAAETGAAWALHKKRGQEPQYYRVRYEPQIDGGGQLVANKSLRSYGTSNLATQSESNTRRLAAQALINLNPYYDQNKAADKYAHINQLKGKEVHHLTEIDTFIRALRSASPKAQIQGVAALLADGFTFGDHKNNQIALWGDLANVPGAKTRSGERNIPVNHPGKGEHQTDGGVHQRIDQIHNLYKLPNTNELGTLENYVKNLAPEEQIAFIKVLGQTHRKGIQDVKNVGESASKRTTNKLEEALADLYMGQLRSNVSKIKSGRDTQSTGSIVGEKPLVINADEGANVYVRTNGNGKKGVQSL